MMIYALFDKETKQIIALTSEISQFPKGSFLVREFDLSNFDIKDDEFNLARFRWIGDYDTGHFQDLFADKKTVVVKEEIDKKYIDIFFRRYQTVDVLFELIKNLPDNNEIKEFLIKLEAKKEQELEFYRNSNNHILETEEEQNKRFIETFSKQL